MGPEEVLERSTGVRQRGELASGRGEWRVSLPSISPSPADSPEQRNRPVGVFLPPVHPPLGHLSLVLVRATHRHRGLSETDS